MASQGATESSELPRRTARSPEPFLIKLLSGTEPTPTRSPPPLNTLVKDGAANEGIFLSPPPCGYLQNSVTSSVQSSLINPSAHFLSPQASQWLWLIGQSPGSSPLLNALL